MISTTPDPADALVTRSALSFSFWQGVGDGDAQLALGEEGVVVFGVSAGDAIARRQSERVQRSGQPGTFVDAARQHHHRALVEDDLQLQAQVADLVEDFLFVRLARRDDDAPSGQRIDPVAPQRLVELWRRRLGQEPFLAVCRSTRAARRSRRRPRGRARPTRGNTRRRSGSSRP